MAAVQCGSHGLACLILQPVLKHQVQEGIIRKQGAEGAISTWKNLLLPPPKHEVGKKEVSELQNKKIQTFGWGCALPVSSSRSFCLCLQFKLCFIDCVIIGNGTAEQLIGLILQTATVASWIIHVQKRSFRETKKQPHRPPNKIKQNK